MVSLFISDLHLSKERPAITRAFFRFLDEHAAEADSLYILGDLFEAWIGDDDPEELAAEVKAALSRLTASGVAVYFLHGNRDFLVGKRFARQTGCTLLGDYHVISAGGQNILLCHGDTLCTGDASYQKFRRKVRNPIYLWLLGHLPLKKRLRLAAEWRAKSMAANSNKPDNIMDVTPAEVEKQLAANNASVLIHGHTHRPGVHQHDNGERVVLGDWGKLGWYVRIDGEHLDLVDFLIDNPGPESTHAGSTNDETDQTAKSEAQPVTHNPTLQNQAESPASTTTKPATEETPPAEKSLPDPASAPAERQALRLVSVNPEAAPQKPAKAPTEKSGGTAREKRNPPANGQLSFDL